MVTVPTLPSRFQHRRRYRRCEVTGLCWFRRRFATARIRRRWKIVFRYGRTRVELRCGMIVDRSHKMWIVCCLALAVIAASVYSLDPWQQRVDGPRGGSTIGLWFGIL